MARNRLALTRLRRSREGEALSPLPPPADLTAYAVALFMLVAPGAAAAAEVTRVASSPGGDGRFDFNVMLSWVRDSKVAAINRELQSDRGASLRTELVPDLVFRQTRNTLNFRVEAGVLKDVGLHVDVPIVISDDRRLDFADGVAEDNSLTLRDGILPGYNNPLAFGRDAKGRSYGRPSRTLFTGPTRSGIEHLGMGVAWAPFNQARDDTKPTWTLGFDARLALGAQMRYDAEAPGANTAVAPGYHQIVGSTFVSRRHRRFDPYFGLWMMFPLRTGGGPFQRHAPGSQSNVRPQQQAGVQFGFEGVAWEDVKAKQQFSIELRGRMEAHFEGRNHAEMWEPLAGSSACATTPAKCRTDIDRDLNGDGKPDPYPGISDVEAFGVFGGDLGVNVQVGRYVRFRGLAGMTIERPHFITFADAGSDLDGNGSVDPARVAPPGRPVESNPAYREIFDLPGRRYRVNDTRTWSLFVESSLMF